MTSEDRPLDSSGSPNMTAPPPDDRLAGLDGLRAFAVAGVVFYHLGIPGIQGGFLGVDLFFVLSGFLITTLLIKERSSTSTISLGSFWVRRARRLLPALFALMVVITVYVVIAGRAGNQTVGALDLAQLRSDGVATLLYVANWHLIATAQSYFTQFSTPSPLLHTWSLAIEEQFYLLWPLALIGLLRARRGSWRKIGAAVALVGATVSAVEMAILFHPLTDPSRVYYGTDTRAFDLLIGAAGAFLTTRWTPSVTALRRLKIAGPAAFALLLVFWVIGGNHLDLPRNFMYRGGFVACAILAIIAIIAAVFAPHGLFARALSLRWLVVVGAASYGIYLWHWPIIVFMNPATTGLHGASLALVRLGLLGFFATASYFLIEMPVRRGTLSRRVKLIGYPLSLVMVVGLLVVASEPTIVAPQNGNDAGHLDLSAVKGIGGLAGQRPINLGGLDPSPIHRIRVGLFGDSMIYVAAPGLAAGLQATGVASVTNLSFPGWGTSTDPGWRATLAASIRSSGSQLLIGTWAWDNAEALRSPAAYEKRLHALVTTARDTGVRGVIFLQYPRRVLPDGTPEATRRSLAAGERAWQHAVIRTVR
ncbi:MAG: acyltransferase, partial [Actinomycetes bacterium]